MKWVSKMEESLPFWTNRIGVILVFLRQNALVFTYLIRLFFSNVLAPSVASLLVK